MEKYCSNDAHEAITGTFFLLSSSVSLFPPLSQCLSFHPGALSGFENRGLEMFIFFFTKCSCWTFRSKLHTVLYAASHQKCFFSSLFCSCFPHFCSQCDHPIFFSSTRCHHSPFPLLRIRACLDYVTEPMWHQQPCDMFSPHSVNGPLLSQNYCTGWVSGSTIMVQIFTLPLEVHLTSLKERATSLYRLLKPLIWNCKHYFLTTMDSNQVETLQC